MYFSIFTKIERIIPLWNELKEVVPTTAATTTTIFIIHSLTLVIIVLIAIMIMTSRIQAHHLISPLHARLKLVVALLRAIS